MSDGNKVDMSLDDIIKMGGRGRGGRGRGAGPRGGRGGRGGQGRGRGAGVGRAAQNQQKSNIRQQQVGRGAGRSQGYGFRRGRNLSGRGRNLSGRGRGLTTRSSFNNRQLSTRGGGVVKRRVGNLRGQGRGRGGMLKLKTAIHAQLQSPGQRNRGRGRGGRKDVTSTNVSATEVQFKNFQVSISGLGSTKGSSDLPEGVSMDTGFSVKHTTGITLNSRFTTKSDGSTSSNNSSRLVTANGRAVKHF